MELTLFSVTGITTCLAAVWSLSVNFKRYRTRLAAGAIGSLPTVEALAEYFDELAIDVQPFAANVALILIDYRIQTGRDVDRETNEIGAQLCARLQSRMAERDLLVRDTNGQLVIAHRVDSLAWVEETQSFCAELLDALKPLFDSNEGSVSVGASVGAAVYPHHGSDPVDLLRKSRVALTEGKHFSDGSYTVYTPGLEVPVLGTTPLKDSELKAALLNDEYVLYFSPIVGLDDGVFVGAEALIRWKRRDGKLLPASKYVDIPDNKKLTIEIGKWVIENACYGIAHLKRRGIPRVRISVNILDTLLAQKDLEATIVDCLDRNGVEGDLLELVLSEFSLVNHSESVRPLIERLRKRGVHFAVAHVGNSRAPLDYLTQWPIENIRIGKEYTDDVSDGSLVALIVRMASTLKLRTVAEGVDSAGTLNALRELGCTDCEGKVFARPLSIEALVEFVREFDFSQSNNVPTTTSNVRLLLR